MGDAIAEVLNNNGIVTINDRTMHDKDSYTGSYSRSEKTVREYLEKYPSIKVVIDGHGNSLPSQTVQKSSPLRNKRQKSGPGYGACRVRKRRRDKLSELDGKPRSTLLLQRRLEGDYPGLARTMSFKSCKYNFNIINGSILLEIGTEANTLDEAIYSGQLIGEALVKVFKGQ